MKFRFTLDVEVERTEGKFASREEISAEIIEWLESANDSEVSGVGSDGESVYEITDWNVEETS